MKVNRVFFIHPEPFQLQRADGEAVTIAPPCSWSGVAPVQVRLLSYQWREGQVYIEFPTMPNFKPDKCNNNVHLGI